MSGKEYCDDHGWVEPVWERCPWCDGDGCEECDGVGGYDTCPKCIAENPEVSP